MKAHCLPFSQIPHTTGLFTDFLAYAPAVQPFYPRPPHFAEWFEREAEAIDYNAARRGLVSAILERQNKSFGSRAETLANIARLRAGAYALVTGQQVGLFGGPAFALYKALTAVKLAEEATTAGVDCVPVFWLATSDHDLAEVNHVSIPGHDGLLRVLSTSSHGVSNAPVSEVLLGDEILPALEEAAALLGDSQATDLLREAYRPGQNLGSAFARLYAQLFAEWGVILLDASDPELHRVAEPLYRRAIEDADVLDAALLKRGEALDHAGYFQQVKVTPSSVLLFSMREGARTAIHHRAGEAGKKEFAIGPEPGAQTLTEAELLARVAAHPEQFSPNVLLRPVVQDYLLPTLAYTGGAAEAAYFAQAGVVYETLLGRVTPIVPRFSATIVEPKTQRWLRQYDFAVSDVFHGFEALRQNLAARALPADLQTAFDRTGKSIGECFSTIQEALAKLDPTLVDACRTAASKAQYQLERLRERATAAELRRSEIVVRHAEALSHALYPDDALQERGIAGIYFIARHGMELLPQLYENLSTDCHNHQILQL